MSVRIYTERVSFDDNDREIAKDPRRKILTNEELEEIRVKKRKNRHDFNLN